MNLGKLFIQPKEIEEAKAHFQSLRENSDWKYLVENVVQKYIKELTDVLLSPETKWEYAGQEQETRRIREHWVILSELPEELLKSLIEPKEEEEEKSDDPYFQPKKKK